MPIYICIYIYIYLDKPLLIWSGFKPSTVNPLSVRRVGQRIRMGGFHLQPVNPPNTFFGLKLRPSKSS